MQLFAVVTRYDTICDKMQSLFLLPHPLRVLTFVWRKLHIRIIYYLLCPNSSTFLIRENSKWRINDCSFNMITWFPYQMTSSSHVNYHAFDIWCSRYLMLKGSINFKYHRGVVEGSMSKMLWPTKFFKDFIHWTLFISQILMNVRWNRAQITASVKTHLAVLIVLVNPVFQADVAQVRTNYYSVFHI